MENELDCRGLQCPEPVARCRALIAEKKPNVLQVLVDNAAALENVQRYLTRNGYVANARQTGQQEWRITASKDGSMPDLEPAPRQTGEKTLVLLTTETLGRGDDELGAKLMATFLANLTELGDSLWRVILLNGAVKLSAKEGEPLKHLKSMADGGVGIFVCGTCLMHYGLMEKKQVGETTNMMDVVTSMAMAQKIIRP